jgi:ankyrin repeat protein
MIISFSYLFHNQTPLHCASQCGHLNIVEYLVNKGANIEAEDKNIL